MKLRIRQDRTQPDPFIFKDGDVFYLYVTGEEGVEAYTATDILGDWTYYGIVAKFEGKTDYWAPSVIRYDGAYYIYVSCNDEGTFQEYMHVAKADSPLGPFTNEKQLYTEFSIDSHAVETSAGLFLWHSQNRRDGERIGTRIFVDRLLDPYTPEHKPVEKLRATFDEEIFTPDYDAVHNPWHTIEGAFWFQKEEWQYLMYSGGCYQDDTYHIGYAAAKTREADLTKVEFTKHTENGKFAPVIIQNAFEEGTGHHSVLCLDGEWYAFYHGREPRDLAQGAKYGAEYEEKRTARICRLLIEDGQITAERYEDHI